MDDLRPAKRLPIYTEADELTNALLEGEELSPELEERLERLTEVWAILLRHPAAIAIIKIMRRFDVKRSRAYEVMRQAEDFYGEIADSKIKAERIKQKLRLEGYIYDKKTPVEIKIRAEKLLTEILGTKVEAAGKRPRKRQIIRRTTNAAALVEEVITEE